jgi:hypothetical protein
MNERIDQLMVKAGAVFGGDGVVYDNFDPKKFAQLIVQECAELTLDYRDPNYYAGWMDYRDEIKRHFGDKS